MPLLRVATFPVVLRAILTAKRAGATKFLVVLDSAKAREIRRELEHTRRLPAGVEWLTLADGTASLTATLREIAGRVDNHFLLVPGEATFHPSLLEKIISPDGHGALALTVSGQPTGIYQFERQTLRRVADEAPSSLRTLNDLHRWMSQKQLLKREEADETFWQPITCAQDLSKAEAKLNRWLFKDTDGIFARLNRRISIPISRQLIKTPITPNMVTIFTMLVSFVSGIFFALGGYANTLVGALLSYGGSILDGVDGEVARLTSQESDFGCWLETVGDYLSYIFIFAGMAIGLSRTSHSIVYPITGGLLLFGTLMSTATLIYQRKLSNRNQPEKFGTKWQRTMEGNKENLIFRFARIHHFLLRRAFLPYAFLFFALINFTQFVIFAGALGANLTWSITLYSNGLFRGDRVRKTSEQHFQELLSTRERHQVGV
jgi:phosphatidylglycerophosphate synthase/choline kinase